MRGTDDADSVASNYIEMVGNGNYGTCDKCDDSAVMIARYPDRVERRCRLHNSEDIQAANLATLKQQKTERDGLSTGRYLAIVIHVDHDVNLSGQYVASVANPINSCQPGFGSTPYRALRELGLRLSEEADGVLHRIKEHEMELRANESNSAMKGSGK